MHKKLLLFFLFFILLIASALRLWNISNNPAGFFVDEASHGLEAYSILTTGKDTEGKPFPVIFRATGDYRDPVMIYSTIPFVAVFGLHEFSVRLVSSFYGIAAVLMIFLVGKVYVNEKVGLWAALLLAISPWHVHFSRVGFQLITSVFWLLFALYFLKKSFKNIRYYILATIGFVLTFFSYSTTKIYLPFLFIFFIFCYPKEIGALSKKRLFWFSNIFAVVLVLLLIYPHLKDGTFFKRWTQVDKNVTVQESLNAYINHFSPQFLFITGDAQFQGQDVQRHSIHGVGELYWFQILFLFISIAAFLVSRKERQKLLFFILFLYIYPIGSIFTDIKPQATRSILGVIPFTILTAYGIEEITKLFKKSIFKKLFYISFIVLIGVSTFLLVVAMKNYPLQSADYMGWQYGYRPAVAYIQQYTHQYDNLFVTHRFNMGMTLLDFYKYEYPCPNCAVMNNPIIIDTTKKQLFVLRPEDIKEASELYPELYFEEQQVIRLPNGKEELFVGAFYSL